MEPVAPDTWVEITLDTTPSPQFAEQGRRFVAPVTGSYHWGGGTDPHLDSQCPPECQIRRAVNAALDSAEQFERSMEWLRMSTDVPEAELSRIQEAILALADESKES